MTHGVVLQSADKYSRELMCYSGHNMMTKEKIVEALGWYGALAVTGAFALNSFGYLEHEVLWYQLLNFTGAAALAVITLYHRIYQSAIVNVIWTLIALVALVKILL